MRVFMTIVGILTIVFTLSTAMADDSRCSVEQVKVSGPGSVNLIKKQSGALVFLPQLEVANANLVLVQTRKETKPVLFEEYGELSLNVRASQNSVALLAKVKAENPLLDVKDGFADPEVKITAYPDLPQRDVPRKPVFFSLDQSEIKIRVSPLVADMIQSNPAKTLRLAAIALQLSMVGTCSSVVSANPTYQMNPVLFPEDQEIKVGFKTWEHLRVPYDAATIKTFYSYRSKLEAASSTEEKAQIVSSAFSYLFDRSLTRLSPIIEALATNPAAAKEELLETVRAENRGIRLFLNDDIAFLLVHGELSKTANKRNGQLPAAMDIAWRLQLPNQQSLDIYEVQATEGDTVEFSNPGESKN